MSAPAGPAAAWADACLAAALLAVDPSGLGGIGLRARHGPVRDRWLAGFRALLPEGVPERRVPAHVGDERLLGGLDLPATLAAGRPVAARGLLAEADGGIVLLPMAERAEPRLAARLGMALDIGAVRAERDGLSLSLPARIAVVALDESAGEAGERGLDPALADRLAFLPDLSAVPVGVAGPMTFRAADIAAARARLAAGAQPGEEEAATLEALTGVAVALGIDSLRAPLLALRAARAALALLPGALTAREAAEIGGRLVLGPRATRLPAEEAADPAEETPPEPPEPPDDSPPPETDEEEALPDGPLTDRVLEAARAALPADLLARLMDPGALRRGEAPAGRAGAERRAPDRGRPIGARPGRPGGRFRLDLVETLRAAAPWQPLRRSQGASGISIRPEDFRLRRFKRHGATATVFVVDASGSAAVARLAEAKGAVELLLAEAYVRRDQVALVAFRGTSAEVLLPPTQSPALAKKRLAALPGGGGTPLAAGLEAGWMLAHRLIDRGVTPVLMVLTDGRANIGRDGQPGRPRAAEDALAAAQALRAFGIRAMVIDTGLRPQPQAEALARAMGARYLALPRAEARVLTEAARAAATG